MTHTEFMLIFTPDDLIAVSDALRLRSCYGYSATDFFAAGLVRLFGEHGEDDLTEDQWRVTLQTAVRRERWRLVKEVQEDQKRSCSLRYTTPDGEQLQIELRDARDTQLNVLLFEEAEALLEQTMETMRQIVDEMVAARRIPVQRQEGCKQVFAAFIADPTCTLGAYGAKLAPHIPRQRLYEYWDRVCEELIRRFGDELLIRLRRPKSPKSGGACAALPARLPKAAPSGTA